MELDTKVENQSNASLELLKVEEKLEDRVDVLEDRVLELEEEMENLKEQDIELRHQNNKITTELDCVIDFLNARYDSIF